jgi:hypothetical protein
MIGHVFRNHPSSRLLVHLHANIIMAGLTGALIAMWTAAWAETRMSSPGAITALCTAAHVLTFVPTHLLLHYLVFEALRDRMPVQPRFWHDIRVIYAAGAVSIALFLSAVAAGQEIFMHLGARAEHASIMAHGLGHGIARLVPPLLQPLLQGSVAAGLGRELSASARRGSRRRAPQAP